MKTFLIAVTLFISINASCQRTEAYFFDSSLTGYVSQLKAAMYKYVYAHPDDHLISSCQAGCAVAVFKVDANGKIINLEFTKNTKTEWKEYLTKAVESTNGRWKSAIEKGKPVTSSRFLLPFTYGYLASCKNTDDYKRILEKFSNDISFMLLLDKTDELLSGGNYYILPPIKVGVAEQY